MVKRCRILTLMFVILLLAIAILSLPLTKADTNQPLTFSSGLTLYSPVNTTYNSDIVLCNGSFDCPTGVACSLNYSIDGVYRDGLQWKLDSNSIGNPYNYTIDGAFPLPSLPNGSHQLSIGITESTNSYYDYNSTVITHKTTWVNTVYFTTSSSEPTPIPTPTPIATPPSTITPIPSNRNAPHLDPINYLLPISVIVAVIIALALLFYIRHSAGKYDNWPRRHNSLC